MNHSICCCLDSPNFSSTECFTFIDLCTHARGRAISLVLCSLNHDFQIYATLRMGAVTGSSRSMMTWTGFDSRGPVSPPTQGQIATTPPTHPQATTSTCRPLLLTTPVRRLNCPHHFTLQVRAVYTSVLHTG